jgi:predicted phage-related endonuclease
MPEIQRLDASDQATWLSLRGRDVTASSAGALFGVHEYVTPFLLWALKSGRVADDPEDTPPMRRGRLLEPVAVAILQEDNPRRTKTFTHNAGPGRIYLRDAAARVGATPDVFVDDERGVGIIQIKSVEASIYRKKWINPDTHEVEPPLWIAVQTLLEGHLNGADWLEVAALVVGHGVELQRILIAPNPSLINRLYDRVGEFWRMIERGDEPAPDYAQDGATIARMYDADDGGEMDLGPRASEIVEARAALKADIKAAEAGIETLNAEMKDMLGNCAIGVLDDGRKVTWRTTHRKAYQVPESQFRTLRFPREQS